MEIEGARKVNYLQESWGVLVVLDACRYDVFKEVVDEGIPIPGTLEKIDSQAVNSQGWYQKHWAEPVDVQLITSNPKPFMEKSRKNGKVIKHNFAEAIDAWVGRGVNPHVTLGFFHARNNPDKRTILHLMPPHLPYIGPKGKKFLKGLESEDWGGGVTTYQRVQLYGRYKEEHWDELRGYYKEGLVTVLEALAGHVENMGDEVVITADHAELIGEVDEGKSRYHHYPAKDPELRKLLRTVPWYRVKI